jgi:bifunctional DNA-binding transcriptional regulator/antitoxin component of YhaV-PrlF toxin-antitoxin module
MIVVRILDEGQFALPDEVRDELEARDARLLEALETDDETAYTAELVELLGFVHQKGSELPLDVITPSEFVLPGRDFSMAGVRDFLGDHAA